MTPYGSRRSITPRSSVRLQSQRILERQGPRRPAADRSAPCAASPKQGGYTLCGHSTRSAAPIARKAIGPLLTDASPRVRLQAARSVGIRRDQVRAAKLASS